MRQSIVLLHLLPILVKLHIAMSHDEPAADLVRVKSSGFLAFEPPVLPYGVIERIQAQQLRIARHRQWSGDAQEPSRRVQQPVSAATQAHSTQATKTATPKLPLHRQTVVNSLIQPRSAQLRLERSRDNAKRFNLYDADGERLLDVQYYDTAGTQQAPLTAAKSASLAAGKLSRLKPRTPPKQAKDVQHFVLQL